MVGPNNSPANPRGQTLEAAKEHFITEKQKADGSGNYAQTAKRLLEQWIEAHCSSVETVADVKARHVSNFADYLARRAQAREADPRGEEGITGRTAHQYFSYVSAFLTHCRMWGWIDDNPAELKRVRNRLPAKSLGATDNQQFWSARERRELCDYADELAREAIEEDGLNANRAVRDRALVFLLAYSGARVSELVHDSRDSRRNGISWGDVDLDDGRLTVLGKDQEREDVQLPDQAVGPIQQWRRAYQPASETWPVIPSLHPPSLYDCLPEAADAYDVTPLEALREDGTRPPSISVSGVRAVLKRLCTEGDIDVEGDRDYLTPHGARRGVGETVYRTQGHQAAQRVLRHADPSTTSEMYSHIEASELSDVATDAFDEMDDPN